MQSHTTQLLAQETSSSRAKARTVILYQNVDNLWIRDLGPAPIMAPMVQWRLCPLFWMVTTHCSDINLLRQWPLSHGGYSDPDSIDSMPVFWRFMLARRRRTATLVRAQPLSAQPLPTLRTATLRTATPPHSQIGPPVSLEDRSLDTRLLERRFWSSGRLRNLRVNWATGC